MIYDRNDTTAIAMHCFRCGANISEGYWLADGGPLCSECGQDIREVNTAKNRAKERRETMEKTSRYLTEDRLDSAWFTLYDLQFIAGVENDALQQIRHILAERILLLKKEEEDLLRNSLRRTEERWAEDQSQCHDHVAGRQGEGR